MYHRFASQCQALLVTANKLTVTTPALTLSMLQTNGTATCAFVFVLTKFTTSPPRGSIQEPQSSPHPLRPPTPAPHPTNPPACFKAHHSMQAPTVSNTVTAACQGQSLLDQPGQTPEPGPSCPPLPWQQNWGRRRGEGLAARLGVPGVTTPAQSLSGSSSFGGCLVSTLQASACGLASMRHGVPAWDTTTDAKV